MMVETNTTIHDNKSKKLMHLQAKKKPHYLNKASRYLLFCITLIVY